MENPPRCYCSGSKTGRLMKYRFHRSPKIICRNGCGKTYDPPPPPPKPESVETILQRTARTIRNSSGRVQIYWGDLCAHSPKNFPVQNAAYVIAIIEGEAVYETKLLQDDKQRVFFWAYKTKRWHGGLSDEKHSKFFVRYPPTNPKPEPPSVETLVDEIFFKSRKR